MPRIPRMLTRLRSCSSLRQLCDAGQAYKGKLTWIAIDRMVSQAGGFARLFVFARFLTPADLGLMVAATFVTALLEIMTEVNLDVAVLQKGSRAREYLGAYLFINISRNFFISAVLLVCAPLAAKAWGLDQSTNLIRTMSVVLVIRGLTNPSLVLLKQELNFKKLLYLSLAENAAGLGAAILLAPELRSVWVIPYALIASQFARTFFSYLICPVYFTLADIKVRAFELMSFGKWMTVSSILNFLSAQGDYAAVGRLLGASALGQYQTAFRISEAPRLTATEIISQLAYPLMCKPDADERARQRVYRVSVVICTVLSGIAMLVMIAIPELIIRVLVGNSWISIANDMKVLAVANFLRSVAVLPMWYLYSIGSPDVAAKLTAWRLVVFGVLVYPLAMRYGTYGVCWSVLAGNILLAAAAYKSAPLRFRPRMTLAEAESA
jgi:O-antigen/teichoic acid export membrane protein